jgi:hypothetical protein
VENNSCLDNIHAEKAFMSSLLDPKHIPHRVQSNSNCKGVQACLLYFYSIHHRVKRNRFGPQGADPRPPPPRPLHVGAAGKNHLNEEITPFLPTPCIKNPIMSSFSGNCAASVPVSTFRCLRAIYIPRISSHISCSRIGRSIVEIYKSFTVT